jgi:general secretion pathway protein D
MYRLSVVHWGLSLGMVLTWLCLASIGSALGGEVEPDAAAPATEGQIVLNFRDADILQLVTLMSDLTGKTFLVDSHLRGAVTLVAPSPVSLDEAYQIFLSVLKSRGFTTVAQGPIIKIVPAQKAKESPLPMHN